MAHLTYGELKNKLGYAAPCYPDDKNIVHHRTNEMFTIIGRY